MTHSVKVAQVGRSIAERLRSDFALKAELPIGEAAPDPDLVEAACLAHDLGHPPFGHVGEQALCAAIDEVVMKEMDDANLQGLSPEVLQQELLNRQDSRGGFEGNAQTFRIAAFLSVRGTADGLDLTRATLDALTKYPWSRGQSASSPSKWGFFPTETNLMTWVRNGQIGAGQPKSLEAQIMDWSDDVSYACHDVEDFYRVGVIPLDRLFSYRSRNPDEVPTEAVRFFEWVEDKWSKAMPTKTWNPDDVQRVWRQLSNLILVIEPFRATRQLEIDIRRSTSELLSFFVNSVSVTGTAPLRLQGNLSITADQRLACDLLNELIWFYVIDHPALATQQHGQIAMVRDLFRAYYEGSDMMLPESRREELVLHGDRARCVADHIASMTERQAIALHGRMIGTDVVGILEPIWAT